MNATENAGERKLSTAYVCLIVGTLLFVGGPFVDLWRFSWLTGAVVCCSGALLAAISLTTLPRDRRRSAWLAVLLNIVVPALFLLALVMIVHRSAT